MQFIDGLKSRSSAGSNVVKNTTKNSNIAKKSTKVVAKNLNMQGKRVSTVKAKTASIKEEKKNTLENVSQNNMAMDFVKPVRSFDLDITSSDVEKLKEEQEKQAQDKNKTVKPEEKSKKKKEKKKLGKARKIITSLLLIIVLAIIGLIVWGMVFGNDIISKLTNGQSGIFDIMHLMSEEHVELKKDANGRTNILAFGTSGYNMEGDEGNGVHDGAQLTDSIMVISFDQETHDVAMVSLPRDLKAGRTCTATGKVNEVYWCANIDGDNEKAGADALAEKIKEILGVDIQYYVHVNWQTISSIVDMIGGIDITLDEDIQDYYYTGAVYDAGVAYHLDGGMALGLARARHGTSGGDFTRGNSQQKILIAIKDKIMANGISWTNALSMINSIGDNLRTNISLDEMKTGIWLMGDIDLNGMRQVPLIDYENGINYMTTGMINGISYVLPTAGVDNYNSLQIYIQEKLLTTPVVEEPEITNETTEEEVVE